MRHYAPLARIWWPLPYQKKPNRTLRHRAAKVGIEPRFTCFLCRSERLVLGDCGHYDQLMKSRKTFSSRIQRTAAVLQVNSRTVKSMRDFFVDRLGFEIGTEVGNGPSFVTLDRDGQTIMLACSRSLGFRKRGWAAYFWVVDIEMLDLEAENRADGTIFYVWEYFFELVDLFYEIQTL